MRYFKKICYYFARNVILVTVFGQKNTREAGGVSVDRVKLYEKLSAEGRLTANEVRLLESEGLGWLGQRLQPEKRHLTQIFHLVESYGRCFLHKLFALLRPKSPAHRLKVKNDTEQKTHCP